MFGRKSDRIKVRVYDGVIHNLSVYLTFVILSFLVFDWQLDEFVAVLPELNVPVSYQHGQVEITYIVEGDIFHTTILPDLQTTEILSNDLGTKASWPTWSPNGEALAYVGISDTDLSQDIYLYRGSLHMRLTETLLPKSNVQWSPDGTQLAFIQHYRTSSEAGLWILELATGRLSPVMRPLEACCYAWVNNETLAVVKASTPQYSLLQLKIVQNDLKAAETYAENVIAVAHANQSVTFSVGQGLYSFLLEPSGQYGVYHFAIPGPNLAWKTKLIVFNARGVPMLEYDGVQFGQYSWRPQANNQQEA
jgi:hypothetical protein